MPCSAEHAARAGVQCLCVQHVQRTQHMQCVPSTPAAPSEQVLCVCDTCRLCSMCSAVGAACTTQAVRAQGLRVQCLQHAAFAVCVARAVCAVHGQGPHRVHAVHVQRCACSVCGFASSWPPPRRPTAPRGVCCSSQGLWPAPGLALLPRGGPQSWGAPGGAASRGRGAGCCTLGCPEAEVSGCWGEQGPCCHRASIAACPGAGDTGRGWGPPPPSRSHSPASHLRSSAPARRGERG